MLSFEANQLECLCEVSHGQLKPSKNQLTIQEHFLQLRSHIKLGREPLDGVNPGRYVDQVAYWRERCKRVEDECDRLRSANVTLQRSNHVLPSQTNTTAHVDTAASAQPPSLKKILKRPRQTQSQVQNTAAPTQETINHDLDFLETLGNDGAALLESLFNVHSLCRDTELDHKMLCFNLIRSVSAMGRVIMFAAQHYDTLSHTGHRNTGGAASLKKDKSDFANAFSVCARAFMSILVGADKLVTSESDKRLASLIVCELADMFKTSLKAIEVSAQYTAQSFFSQPHAQKKSRTKVSLEIVKESSPARAVAHLLISFLGLLEKNVDLHQKIFDGFVFILFERVGKRLYFSTFGQQRSSCVETNILPLPEVKDPVEALKHDCDALAMRLEAKALILVLERAMGLAPNHMNSQTLRAHQTSNRTASTMSCRTITTSSRARLNPLAKDRLQRTLVACMYGHSTDDDFLDVLTKPMPQMRLGQIQNVAEVKDENVEQWYKKEVWRLVGWDILARESGW